MLLSIQYLRGIAALLVLLTHMSFLLNGTYAQQNLGDLLFGQFYFGVDLFFVISGFVICLSTEKNESNRCLKYLIRRIFRLYPLLLVSVAVYALIAKSMNINDHGAPEAYNIVKSMLPLHSDYLSTPPFFGYNLLPPAWTLSYEVAFYGLFLFALKVSSKYRVVNAIVIIMATLAAIQIYLTGSLSLNTYRQIVYPDNYLRPIMALLSSPMLVEFIYGMVAFCLYRYVKLPATEFVQITLLMIFTASVIILCSGALLPRGTGEPSFKLLHGPLHWGVIAFLLTVSTTMYEKTFGLFVSRTLNRLGDISYSVYLTQWIWFKILFNLHLFQKMNGASKFLLTGIVVLFASYLTHHLVERTFVIFSRRIISRMKISNDPVLQKDEVK